MISFSVRAHSASFYFSVELVTLVCGEFETPPAAAKHSQNKQSTHSIFTHRLVRRNLSQTRFWMLRGHSVLSLGTLLPFARELPQVPYLCPFSTDSIDLRQGCYSGPIWNSFVHWLGDLVQGS